MIAGEAQIRKVISQYHRSFTAKTYGDENDDHDVIMDVFGLTPQLKRENRQYWGRELGMCWQLVVTELFKVTVSDFAPGHRNGSDELCDLVADGDAIDTKYRIGSGDSGTLKKFKQYGKTLSTVGYRPVFLIVREDNLPAAMKACEAGGWTVYTAQASFDYIIDKTGIDLKRFLLSLGDEYHVNR